MELSVIMPCIHTNKVSDVYNSIKKSFKSFNGSFELIIIGPSRPDYMRNDIRFIESWASPVVCQQLGLIHAQGRNITRMVDDGLYVPGALQRAVDKLETMAQVESAVILKHTETNVKVDRNHKDFQDMSNPDFYCLTYHHQTLKPYVPAHYKIMNFGVLMTAALLAVGGWDCQFETLAIAELDLSIRLQMAGARIELSDEIVVHCGWTPGEEGDHAPMHHGFFADNEKYSKIYSDPSCEDRVRIDLDNWKMAPEKWGRRFGN